MGTVMPLGSVEPLPVASPANLSEGSSVALFPSSPVSCRVWTASGWALVCLPASILVWGSGECLQAGQGTG